jgi:5-formyltetrahydrofolate cyclo-ligase
MVGGVGSGASEEVADEKQAVRERVWRRLEQEGAARFPGARGRIPNFVGAERAAERLAQLDQWVSASTIKANPDAPQLPVRALALRQGKLLYMAVPRLTDRRPFLLIDPVELSVPPRRAASIRGASQHGRPVELEEVRRVDVVVCGSVAVNRRGARVGKGGGFSDLEFALLRESGAVTDRTVIATTAHEVQIAEDDLPETTHDFRVDLIVTPDRVIRCRRVRRPAGILWDHLDAAKEQAIPVLRGLRPA